MNSTPSDAVETQSDSRRPYRRGIRAHSCRIYYHKMNKSYGLCFYTMALRLAIGFDLLRFLPCSNAFAVLRSRPSGSSFLTW